MVDDKYENFLLNLYSELNKHHRTQTIQSNQIITFYIVLVSAFIGYFPSLEYDNFIMHFIFILSLSISVVFVVILIQLRIWQLKYAIGIQMIGSIFISDTVINNYDSFISFTQRYEALDNNKYSLIGSVTCKIIWACVALSLSILLLYVFFLKKSMQLEISQSIFMFTLLSCVYTKSIYVIFKSYLKKDLKGNETTWIIRYLNLKQIGKFE